MSDVDLKTLIAGNMNDIKKYVSSYPNVDRHAAVKEYLAHHHEILNADLEPVYFLLFRNGIFKRDDALAIMFTCIVILAYILTLISSIVFSLLHGGDTAASKEFIFNGVTIDVVVKQGFHFNETHLFFIVFLTYQEFFRSFNFFRIKKEG